MAGRTLQRMPFHPFLFATYPILALFALNIQELEPLAAIRSLLLSLGGTTVFFAVLVLVIRNRQKAALVTSFTLILFFSYGHLYQLLEQHPILGINLGRHRIFVPAYGLLLLTGLLTILKALNPGRGATRILNLIGVLLLIFPLYQITSHAVRASTGQKAAAEIRAASGAHLDAGSQPLPDVYYIILDTYTREDALRRDLNFDNSPFLDELRSLGFYVADCSRSNYSYTLGSLTSALNLNYIPALENELVERGLDHKDIWGLLKHSLVRSWLEESGYQTVAFETGYEWSRLADADIYLGLDRESFAFQRIEPFEALLLKSTAVLALTDAQIKSVAARSKPIAQGINDINFPHQGYIERQLFILAQLPLIAGKPGPKFTFAHILIPHIPFVFGPDGEIRSDPGFYSGKASEPVNDEYRRLGYTGEIQFLNQRLLKILRSIIATSAVPPIIVLQGDHGLRKENRLQIFNAYYLPGGGEAALYPDISPVNSFRVIFDTYFGTNLGRLPDESFSGDDLVTVIPETSAACLP